MTEQFQFRWALFNVVDDHNIHLRFASVDIQTELVMHHNLDERRGIWPAIAHVLAGFRKIGCEVDGEIVLSCEAGLVNNGHLERPGDKVGPFANGHGFRDGSISGVLAVGRGIGCSGGF